jgi:hypothetical protein
MVARMIRQEALTSFCCATIFLRMLLVKKIGDGAASVKGSFSEAILAPYAPQAEVILQREAAIMFCFLLN